MSAVTAATALCGPSRCSPASRTGSRLSTSSPLAATSLPRGSVPTVYAARTHGCANSISSSAGSTSWRAITSASAAARSASSIGLRRAVSMRGASYRSHRVFQVSRRTRCCPGPGSGVTGPDPAGASAGRQAPPPAGSHAYGVRAVKNGARSSRGSRLRPASVESIRSTPLARSHTSSPSASTNSTRCQGMSPPGTKDGSGTRFGGAPRWCSPNTKRAGSKRGSQRTWW